MQSRQDLVSAIGWRWFVRALEQILVITKQGITAMDTVQSTPFDPSCMPP